MSPAPPPPVIPTEMHHSLSKEEGGVRERRREHARSRWGGGVDEQDDGLDRLNDLDVTCGVDLHAFLREERAQYAPELNWRMQHVRTDTWKCGELIR